MENHSTESRKATFSAPSLLVHFRESLHRISGESLLSNKLFDRAHARFTGESTMRALPNRPQLDSLCNKKVPGHSSQCNMALAWPHRRKHSLVPLKSSCSYAREGLLPRNLEEDAYKNGHATLHLMLHHR